MSTNNGGVSHFDGKKCGQSLTLTQITAYFPAFKQIVGTLKMQRMSLTLREQP